MNYIVEIPKQWRMGLSQSRLWHLKSGNSASGIEKLSMSIFFQKRHSEMETKLSMLVMQNLLATCRFYMIIMCSTGIKTFFFLLFCQLYVT